MRGCGRGQSRHWALVVLPWHRPPPNAVLQRRAACGASAARAGSATFVLSSLTISLAKERDLMPKALDHT